MNIELLRAEKNNTQLNALFPVYVSEMVQYLDPSGHDNKSINPNDILENYWHQLPNWPYLIYVDKKIAGFCLLRLYPGEPGTIDVDQCYISSGFRRRGVGTEILARLTTMHPGNWLIRVLKNNEIGFRFWINAVERCTCNGYEYRCEKSDTYFIRFSTEHNQQ